jgi:putative transcriptional regulator
MSARKQYRSSLMASIHETVEGLNAAGVMDKKTLHEFDELCVPLAQLLTPENSKQRTV